MKQVLTTHSQYQSFYGANLDPHQLLYTTIFIIPTPRVYYTKEVLHKKETNEDNFAITICFLIPLIYPPQIKEIPIFSCYLVHCAYIYMHCAWTFILENHNTSLRVYTLNYVSNTVMALPTGSPSPVCSPECMRT